MSWTGSVEDLVPQNLDGFAPQLGRAQVAGALLHVNDAFLFEAGDHVVDRAAGDAQHGTQMLFRCVAPPGHVAAIAGELVGGVGETVFMDADVELPTRMMEDHRVARLLPLQALLLRGVGDLLLGQSDVRVLE